MSEAVDSFNSKIDEIKEDKQKFEILMDEFFESKDINIKELLAEMMLHIIMTRGEELQIKFKELEDQRKLYGDWGTGMGGIQTINVPNTTGVGTTSPGQHYTYPSWSYTGNTYVLSGSGGGASTGDINITGATGGTGLTVNTNKGIIDTNNNGVYTVSCNTAAASSYNVDIDSIVEDIDFESINTQLFENAVTAMSGTWSSTTTE